MSDSMITLQGWVGSAPVLRHAGPYPVANFRLGATPRKFVRATGEWVDDGVTQWFTVNAWRQLGSNVERSLRKGDPVVVHGRLIARSWLNQGVETQSLEIDAVSVGHDLTKGCSMMQKNPRATPAEAGAEWRGQSVEQAAAPDSMSASVDGPPMWDTPGLGADSTSTVATVAPPEPDGAEDDSWAEELDGAAPRDASAA